MASVNDSEDWMTAAFDHAELAAQQLVHFKNPWWNPPWQDVIRENQPSSPAAPTPDDFTDPQRVEAAAPAVMVSEGLVGWGFRGKRSRSITHQGIPEVKRETAAELSPDTPLDNRGGSGASTSGGSGGDYRCSSPERAVKRPRSVQPPAVGDDGGHEIKVVAVERAPVVLGTAKPLRRQGKKKTISELQEEEKLLLEQIKVLQKAVESKRRVQEAAKAENQRLKSLMLNLQARSSIMTNAIITFENARSQQIKSSHASLIVPTPNALSLLPDLNELPLPEN